MSGRNPFDFIFGKVGAAAKRSAFFTGTAISNVLARSYYGTFTNAMKQFLTGKEDASKCFTLPVIVVVGQESSGKSSLLENITKCPIFPRGARACTKCPVKVEMRQSDTEHYEVEFASERFELADKDAIYTKVYDLIRGLQLDERELIVRIQNPAVPTLTLVDLPGVCEYPPDVKEKTHEMSARYIGDGNNVVICVVPATTPRLTSSQTVGMVQTLDAAHRTILCITMADIVSPENLHEFVIDRVLLKAADLVGVGVQDCVAVINRLHTDVVTLDEANEKEGDFFRAIVDAAPDNMPELKASLTRRFGVNALVDTIDAIFKRHIVTDWVPNASSQVESEIRLKGDQLSQLGGVCGEDWEYDEWLRFYLSGYCTNAVAPMLEPGSFGPQLENEDTLVEPMLAVVRKIVECPNYHTWFEESSAEAASYARAFPGGEADAAQRFNTRALRAAAAEVATSVVRVEVARAFPTLVTLSRISSTAESVDEWARTTCDRVVGRAFARRMRELLDDVQDLNSLESNVWIEKRNNLAEETAKLNSIVDQLAVFKLS